MHLLEQFVRLYAPYTCLGCDAEHDQLLCDACREVLPQVPSRCYRCKATTRDFAVCDRCRSQTPLRHVYVVAHYDGLAKELLHRAKYERAKSGLAEIAELMAPLLSAMADDVLLVPVPTATSRVRQRGYDQAVVLATNLSRLTRFARMRALARLGQAHQVGANRRQRLEHLSGAFEVVRPSRVRGQRIVLIDDVITTGATLETAARTLKKAGARQVDAVVFSQPS